MDMRIAVGCGVGIAISGMAVLLVYFGSAVDPYTDSVSQDKDSMTRSFVSKVRERVPGESDKTAESSEMEMSPLGLITDPDDGLFKPMVLPDDHQEVTYSMINAELTLTPDVIVAADLSTTEVGLIEYEIKNLWNEVTSMMLEHTSRDHLRSDLANGIASFVISPFPDAGFDARVRFEHKVVEILGRRKASVLLKGFKHTSYFNGFGRAEVLLTIAPVRHPEGGMITSYAHEWRDPKTARTIRKGLVTDPLHFENHYGLILDSLQQGQQ